jgi:hypothetical protein
VKNLGGEMQFLFVPTVIILALIAVDIIGNDKRKYYYYILMFILMSLGNYLFSSTVEASERVLEECEYEWDFENEAISSIIFHIPNSKIEIKHLKAALNSIKALSQEDIKLYQDKVKYHTNMGKTLYEYTKRKVWWLPSVSNKEKARYCYTTAIATLGAGSPYSKIVAVTLSLLLQYGLDCIDEWDEISEKFYWMKYHFEMAEFYQDVLDKLGK